jgi:dTDP-4-amino-4,6-dideoxygalactose transaminase
MIDITSDKRFKDFPQFTERIPLAIPHMHGDEIDFVQKAYDTGWVTTAGADINELEKKAAEYMGVNYAVALSSGTAALHLAIRLCAEKLYHSNSGITTPDGLGTGGSLFGKRVFCSDVTFAATVNPVIYEGGEPVYIDTEYETWNMDPAALEKAFEIYPNVQMVVLVHLYGTPAKIEEIKAVCNRHGALLVEDAAEALGASYKGQMVGSFGDVSVISFNGNKIITGSSGGMFLTNEKTDADRVRKWSTQAREAADWYEHEEIGYNYRMSNIIAGLVRGQWNHIDEHIATKKAIYDRYKDGFKDLPVSVNPYDESCSIPNFWLTCLIINNEAMSEQSRGDRKATYVVEEEHSCPQEIMDALRAYHVESRPIWKPMHLQPVFRNNGFISKEGMNRGSSNAYNADMKCIDVGRDIFNRGLCLPSDIGMTEQEQDNVIEVIRRCFGKCKV